MYSHIYMCIYMCVRMYVYTYTRGVEWQEHSLAARSRLLFPNVGGALASQKKGAQFQMSEPETFIRVVRREGHIYEPSENTYIHIYLPICPQNRAMLGISSLVQLSEPENFHARGISVLPILESSLSHPNDRSTYIGSVRDLADARGNSEKLRITPAWTLPEEYW